MPSFTLSGPSLPTASGGPARQAVMFLHGVGADGNDLIGLAPYFARHMPDATFLSPDAPFPFDQAAFGRQWFALRDFSPARMLEGVQIASPYLDGFIDETLEKLNLPDEKLALVGFSQGTMMALQVGLRRRKPLGCIVGLSGRLLGGDLLDKEIASRPPVLLEHGEDDPVIPYASLEATRRELERLGVPVEAFGFPQLGHSIGPEGLGLAVEFVVRSLGVAT